MLISESSIWAQGEKATQRLLKTAIPSAVPRVKALGNTRLTPWILIININGDVLCGKSPKSHTVP